MDTVVPTKVSQQLQINLWFCRGDSIELEGKLPNFQLTIKTKESLSDKFLFRLNIQK